MLEKLQKNSWSKKSVTKIRSKFSCGIVLECVVPENIQTPTMEGIGNSRGVGGSEVQEIPEGRGVGP